MWATKGKKHRRSRAVKVSKGWWAQATQIPEGKKQGSYQNSTTKMASLGIAMPRLLLIDQQLPMPGCIHRIWRQTAGHRAPTGPLAMFGHSVLSARLSILPALEPRQCTSHPFSPVGRSDCTVFFLEVSCLFHLPVPLSDPQGLALSEWRQRY